MMECVFNQANQYKLNMPRDKSTNGYRTRNRLFYNQIHVMCDSKGVLFQGAVVRNRFYKPFVWLIAKRQVKGVRTQCHGRYGPRSGPRICAYHTGAVRLENHQVQGARPCRFRAPRQAPPTARASASRSRYSSA